MDIINLLHFSVLVIFIEYFVEIVNDYIYAWALAPAYGEFQFHFSDDTWFLAYFTIFVALDRIIANFRIP